MPPHHPSAPRGQIVTLNHESRVLRGNPLGDPSTRDLLVYLPPGYEDDLRRRYPVIWVLTGFTGSGRMLENLQAWTPPLSWRMDRLIAAGAPPAILAMPDCFTRLGGSQYLDSPATGRYRAYLVDELVGEVDRRFRTMPDRRHRGVMGKSSGGYGAIMLGMEAADVFGAVACHSGDMMFELCYGADFPKVAAAVNGPEALAEWFMRLESQEKRGSAELAVLNILAMAACYSPSQKEPVPLAFDLPFDLETCEIIPEIFDRWLARDPLRMIDEPRYRDALASLELLFLDCGNRDEFLLHFGARALVRKLKAHGVRHTYEEFPDGHMSITYRYDKSLPLLARALVG